MYLNHEPDDPAWNDIWRALGAIMGESQRDAFLDAFDIDEAAETACIRRLITGEEMPPLWLDDGEPAVYSMHVYPGNIERLDAREPPYNLWFDLFEFAAEWGLEVSILPKSWYNLGSTVHVIFYPPERFRS
ncbi:hypothetical protein C495_01060 [Natronorubrum sulfidifaciens JCM 14089]|uniref:Uncharacterized protein n=1 Tax=Natronorubrum sulfidifaciens JCM 14089 TaxID=1230460 RepID=L9WHD8_9EURY|nr:hypothetical protein C495_01060 [Natronorubrum sulfidifaciens JCM 14089]